MATIGTIGKQTWCGWVGAGLLALGLAACGTPQPPAGSTTGGPPAVDGGLARATPAPPANTGKGSAESAAEAPAPATQEPGGGVAKLPEPKRPEVALAVPPEALPGPKQLMGLSGDQLRSLLGSPGFVRRDPPAEIWQYGTDDCVLDLFLYSREKGLPHRVSHFEFRGRTVAEVTPAACYRQLLAARASAAAN